MRENKKKILIRGKNERKKSSQNLSDANTYTLLSLTDYRIMNLESNLELHILHA